MAAGYNFGVDAEEVILTLVGFASQHEIFNLMALDSPSDLGWVAYGFGLIGFLMMLLLPASWNFKTIASWFVLFLIVIVRPLGEPAFFSNAAAVAEPALASATCPSGGADTVECAAIHAQQGNEVTAGGPGSIGYYVQGSLEERGYASDLSFKVYTPEAAAIDLLNDLNYSLAVGLHDLGPRALERHFSSIEAIRRAANSDAPTAYNMSEFLATCGRKLPEAAQVAYMRSQDIERERGPLWEQMEGTTLSAADGVLLYQNYANYVRGMDMAVAQHIYPPLVCGADSSDCPGRNAYIRNVRDRRIDKDLFESALSPILYEGEYEEMDSEVSEQLAETPGVDVSNLIRQQYVGGTLTDLENELAELGDNAFGRLEDQPVSLVIPLDPSSETQNQLIDASGLPLANGEEVGNWPAVAGGCAAGAGSAATGLAAAATFIFPGVGTAVGYGVGAALGCVIGGGISYFAWGDSNDSNHDQDRLVTPVVDPNAPGFVVSNCADMHRVIDLRIVMSTQSAEQFRVDLQELQEDYPEAFSASDPDFSALPPQAQTHAVLTTAMGTAQYRCGRERYGSDVTDAQIESCTNSETERIQSLMVLSRNLTAENSQPLAQNMVEQAGTPEFQSLFRTGLAWLGEKVAPLGVAFKSAIGGFSAGTYSRIMPMVVAYATVIMIILTPLIYMVGLAVPTWSFGILFMPLVVIVYFQLTKIIFTMIGVINGIFLATNDQNILSGNMIDFADLVMGFAYTSAFILTGFFMFALKNPVGAIQQVAGAADNTSTISGQEALAMAFTVAKAGKLIAAGPKALASGAGAAKGASAATAAAGGSKGAQLLSAATAGLKNTMSPAPGRDAMESGENAYEDSYMRTANKEDKKKYSGHEIAENRKRVAEGKHKKAKEERALHIAKATGHSADFKPRTGIKKVSGENVSVPLDGPADFLLSEADKEGIDLYPAVERMMNSKELKATIKSVEVDGREGGNAIHLNIENAVKHGISLKDIERLIGRDSANHMLDSSGNVTNDIRRAMTVYLQQWEGVPPNQSTPPRPPQP